MRNKARVHSSRVISSWLFRISCKFVYEIKEYLEKTFNFGSFSTAYNKNDVTLRESINGEIIRFDLIGPYYNSNEPIEIYIEAKKYTTSSGLISNFKKFLKDSFSVWVKKRQISNNWKAKFLFIATHPFACQNFSNLKSYSFLEQLIEEQLELIKFLKKKKEEVISDFLNFFEILIITDSKDLISPNIPKIVELSKLFS